MQIAYSLLLSEYIPANTLDYEDYRRFLIVCPACYEPLFKVVRSTATNDTPNTQHFYSHYARDKAYNDNCELRCTAITASQIDKTAAYSRGQKLALFLSVLQDQIALFYNDHPDLTSLEQSQKFVHRMLKSRALNDYLNEFFSYLRNLKHDLLVTNINLTFDSYLQQLADNNQSFKDYPTTFSLQVQKRIATDILKHLLTIKARPTFNFVFCHAYQNVIFNIDTTRQRIPVDTTLLKIYEVMNRLPQTGRKQGLRLQRELKEYFISWPKTENPTLLEQTRNLWEEMSIRILVEIVKIILRLPYYELLQAAYTRDQENPKGPIGPFENVSNLL